MVDARRASRPDFAGFWLPWPRAAASDGRAFGPMRPEPGIPPLANDAPPPQMAGRLRRSQSSKTATRSASHQAVCCAAAKPHPQLAVCNSLLTVFHGRWPTRRHPLTCGPVPSPAMPLSRPNPVALNWPRIVGRRPSNSCSPFRLLRAAPPAAATFRVLALAAWLATLGSRWPSMSCRGSGCPTRTPGEPMAGLCRASPLRGRALFGFAEPSPLARSRPCG